MQVEININYNYIYSYFYSHFYSFACGYVCIMKSSVLKKVCMSTERVTDFESYNSII